MSGKKWGVQTDRQSVTAAFIHPVVDVIILYFKSKTILFTQVTTQTMSYWSIIIVVARMGPMFLQIGPISEPMWDPCQCHLQNPFGPHNFTFIGTILKPIN